MRKIWISILWLVAASNMGAADMMHLLGGGYDAKVMTPAELDSVLNGTTAVNTHSSGQYTSQNAAERYRSEVYAYSFVYQPSSNRQRTNV